MPGKADWFASGLPREGRLASVATIGEAARRDVPTCAPAEKVGAVRERVHKAGWDRCAVVNKERAVLGLLRERALLRPQVPSRGGNEERSCHVSVQRAGWEDG